jgi:hypothetical protein
MTAAAEASNKDVCKELARFRWWDIATRPEARKQARNRAKALRRKRAS